MTRVKCGQLGNGKYYTY